MVDFMPDDARWLPFVSEYLRFRHPQDATLQVLDGPPLPEGVARIFLRGPTTGDPHGGNTPTYNMSVLTCRESSSDTSLKDDITAGFALPAGSEVVFQPGQHQGQAVTWLMLGNIRTGMIARTSGRVVLVRWEAQSEDSPLEQILQSLTFAV
jgi:hypothetical protein